jgi:hypothetical protein
MFSKRIAFNYLEDLAQEFYNNYGRKINTVTRPYQFIGESSGGCWKIKATFSG